MQQQHRDLDLDRISNLPDSILTSILSILSIKEAVKTSLFSHRWKSLWLSLPFLDLDESLGFDSVSLGKTSPRFHSDKFDPKRWLSSTNQILLARARSHRHHPILRCSIRFNHFTENNLLFDSFFLFLCNSGIRNLTLWNNNEDQYHISIHIFFCSSLQSFYLNSCAVRLPAKFTGWHALKSIDFRWTFVSDSDLALIMSSCGALESLCLDGCDGFEKIVVRAPKLLKLNVYSYCEISISLENAPSIIDFGMSLWCLMRPPDVEDDGYDLFEILMNIPHVENLSLVCHQENSEDPVPVVKERIQLPQCLPSDHLLRNLRTLHLTLCLTDADLIPILSCLLSGSPNLHELNIIDDPYGVKSETGGAYWESHQVTDCMKHHLSYVNLELVGLNFESVVKFIGFLLMNACALKRMTVIYDYDSVQPSVVEHDLRCLKWASNNAVLMFCMFS